MSHQCCEFMNATISANKITRIPAIQKTTLRNRGLYIENPMTPSANNHSMTISYGY